MDRIPVSGSSAVLSHAYDEENQELHVELRGARVYAYHPVDRALYDEFMGSPSKGSFLGELRARCSSKRVDDSDEGRP